MIEKKRILVLAPHTDDGEFGCGGSIAKFIEEGSHVYYVAFSIAEESVPDGFPKNILDLEVREATGILGIPSANLIVLRYSVRKFSYVRQEILEDLVRIKKDIRPDLVILPSPHDLHQDHHTVAVEGMRAFKQVSMLGYEVPWNNMTFNNQAFVKLKKSHLELKIKALEAYKSQSGRSYATADFVRSLAVTRGIQIGTEYAEAFEVMRYVVE